MTSVGVCACVGVCGSTKCPRGLCEDASQRTKAHNAQFCLVRRKRGTRTGAGPMITTTPFINLKLSPTEGPLARSLVVLEIETPSASETPSRRNPWPEPDVTYVLVGAGEPARAMVPAASSPLKSYGGHGVLPLGEHRYNFWFVMADGHGLSKLKEKFGDDEVESRFMDFGERRAYLDLELIALATLFTAGGLINRFLHVPMHRVRVARFAM